MKQLNLGDKVRLLYDNLKDIKYTLATYVDMSSKPLDQYGAIIEDHLGKLDANGKTLSGVKLYRNVEPSLVELKLPVRHTSMWGTHSLPIDIKRTEISPTDFASGTATCGMSVPMGLSLKATPANMWGVQTLNFDAESTCVGKTETYYPTKTHDETVSTTIDLAFRADETSMFVNHVLNFDIVAVDIVNQQTET